MAFPQDVAAFRPKDPAVDTRQPCTAKISQSATGTKYTAQLDILYKYGMLKHLKWKMRYK